MAIEKELLEGITLLKHGKEEGFNILYSHTYNYVYSRAKYIMKNEDDALDLTQETFVQAYKGISSLEDPGNVYAWLGSITYNQGMKIYRKRKRELLVNEDSESIFEDLVSTDDDLRPEENAQAKATSEIVMGMINELPEVQRAAVVAFYYDNMKIEQIAELFECSANTIKSRLNYARKFLKGKVEEHERQNRYKLCAVSPAIMFMALKSLFASEAYTMAPAVAGNIYTAACSSVGVTASAITAGATSTAAATGAATANVGAAAAAGAKVGMTIGAKIGITVTAIATAGAVTTGAVMYANSNLSEHAKIKAAIEEDLENRGMLEANPYNLDLYVDGVFAESTESENEIAQEILDEIITPEMSELLQVKAIHDYMVMHLDSDYDFFTSGNIPEAAYAAEGTLTTKYGISSGYARTFEVLCDNAGIECEYVVGTTEEGVTAWNQVQIDGQWYNIDVSEDDPTYAEKEFDDHSNNGYTHFMFNNSKMYDEYIPHSPINECVAVSIGEDAYGYGCIWLEINPSMHYIETEPEIEAAVLKAVENGESEFDLFYRTALYNDAYIVNYAQNVLMQHGYCAPNNIHVRQTDKYGASYYCNTYFTVNSDMEKREFFGSEEELKEFILELATQEDWNVTREALFSVEIDGTQIGQWAIAKGIRVAAGSEREYFPNYYNGRVTIYEKNLDILTTSDQIHSKILEHYALDVPEYAFLYDYRNTGMTENDAKHALDTITAEYITNANTIRYTTIESTILDGMLICRCYYSN